jgi:peptidyl-dipeptidase A
MSVEMGELGQEWLFKTLDELAEASDGPFRAYKSDLDKKLASRFRCREEELMPWHYGGRFFQLPPKAGEIDLDSIFTDRDVVELTVKTFDRLEIDIRPIVEKSSLYPGDPETSKKCQHAFCTSPDAPGDVRILCNVINNDRWMMVMLHEFGHGVDSAGLSPDLPYFMRGHAHTLTTESIALMMERHRYKSKWLQEIAGVEKEQADVIESEAASIMAVKHLVFTRWVMVMCHFERALYERPDDPGLDGYWWDLVEKFQGLRRPDSESKPDWASKIHLAGSPAYYQNYLLGEVFGAQLEDYIDENFGGVALNPDAGKFLNEKMFANGARWLWRDLLKRLTGSDLRLEPFIEKLTP